MVHGIFNAQTRLELRAAALTSSFQSATTPTPRSTSVPHSWSDLGLLSSRNGQESARELLIGGDGQSKFAYLPLGQCKGIEDERIAEEVLQSFRVTGSTKMLPKSDGEPAIVQLD